MVLMVSAGPGSGFQFDTHSVQHMSSVNKLQKRKPQRRGDRSQMPPRNLLHCWSLCSRSALHTIYNYKCTIYLSPISPMLRWCMFIYDTSMCFLYEHWFHMLNILSILPDLPWSFHRTKSCTPLVLHAAEHNTPKTSTKYHKLHHDKDNTRIRVWNILILLGSETVEGLTCSDGIPSTTSALQPCSLAAPWRSSKTPTCLWRSRIAPNPGQLWGTGGFHRFPKGEHQSSKLLIIWQMMK